MNKFQLITNEVKKVINGKDRAVVTTLLALLTGGNILIEEQTCSHCIGCTSGCGKNNNGGCVFKGARS